MARKTILLSCHYRSCKLTLCRKCMKCIWIYETGFPQSASLMGSNVWGKGGSSRKVEGKICSGHLGALESPFIAIMSLKGW
jgi:hypothetical protein